MLLLGFLFLLFMLYVGSRYGGVGLGAISGLGLLIEIFVFRYQPTNPPIEVMLIITAVVVCASILEAGGGLLLMLKLAEKALRNNPKYVTFLAPITTYLMTVMLGTGHGVYTIMPVIGDVALKNKVRPERPMAAASVASQLAITASPISAAAVYYVDTMSKINPHITLLTIIGVTLPATFCGMLALAFYSSIRGKDLYDDPEFLKKMENPAFKKMIEENSASVLDKEMPKSANMTLIIFLLAIVSIVVLALVPSAREITKGKPISMAVMIQIVMLAAGGLMLAIAKVPVAQVPSTTVFKSGFVAVIAIFGIAWMSDTFFAMAMPLVKGNLASIVATAPWLFAIAMFLVSIMINSQAATAKMVLPIGVSLGLSPAVLIGLIPSCYAYFFIPNYPSDIATCNFDITGTTKIGKYYFNHSFMLPGLIGVGVACVVGYAIASFIVPAMPV